MLYHQDHPDLPSQVVRIYLSAPTEALDVRMRQQGILDEWGIQQHLADAVEQDKLYRSSLQQQEIQQNSFVEMVDCDQALQLCYSRVKDVFSQHWPHEQKHTPGLLLIQKEELSRQRQQTGKPTAAGSTGSRSGTAEEGLDVCGLEMGLFTNSSSSRDEPSSTGMVGSMPSSVLRIQSITAAGAMLQLPRGKHLLRLTLPSWGLHAVSLAAAVPFSVGEAVKVLAAAHGTHVLCQEGEHEAFQPGTVQFLFR
jgi:hypothetical protein